MLNTNIYVVSGNDVWDNGKKDEKNTKPFILAKMNSSGGNVKSYNMSIPAVNANPTQCWEAEGIQIINSDYLYVGMSPKDVKEIGISKSNAYIFSIDRSQIS